MRQILASYAETPYADKSFLLLGQRLAAAGQPDSARKIFADFSRQFPGSTLLPQVDLALARTYTQQKRWDLAIHEYDRWLKS